MNTNNRIEEIKKRLKQGRYYEPYAPDDIEYLLSELSKTRLERNQLEANKNYYKEQLAKAKAEGRLVVLPEGYEHAEELYHVVNLPKWCDEDGNGCEDCRHEVCNGDGASIDCTFKPYVSKIGANAVFDALYTLNGLSLSKESAEKALGGKDDA